jgi:hypothetical protein
MLMRFIPVTVLSENADFAEEAKKIIFLLVQNRKIKKSWEVN